MRPRPPLIQPFGQRDLGTRRGIDCPAGRVDPAMIDRRFHMKKVLAAAAFTVLAFAGLTGAAQAECYWGGNHWNCPDRAIYPKSYPWSTAVINGQYQAADVAAAVGHRPIPATSAGRELPYSREPIATWDRQPPPVGTISLRRGARRAWLSGAILAVYPMLKRQRRSWLRLSPRPDVPMSLRWQVAERNSTSFQRRAALALVEARPIGERGSCRSAGPIAS